MILFTEIEILPRIFQIQSSCILTKLKTPDNQRGDYVYSDYEDDLIASFFTSGKDAEESDKRCGMVLLLVLSIVLAVVCLW